MKKQRLEYIDNDNLQKLNEEGWFIKQVIEKSDGGLACSPTYYYVLLEKESKDMSKGLEALKRVVEWFEIENVKDIETIEKELKDFEWLKSKISIEWFDKLSTDDKLKLMEIMGVKYE